MGYTGLKASLFSALPYLPTVGLLWIGSYISDKTKMRIPIIIFQSILMIIGFIRKPAQYRHFSILEVNSWQSCDLNSPVKFAIWASFLQPWAVSVTSLHRFP